jgi:hypothetical protein
VLAYVKHAITALLGTVSKSIVSAVVEEKVIFEAIP